MKLKNLTIAAKIRAMKPGDGGFLVGTASERTQANKDARSLRDAKVIEFRVKTFKEDGAGYRVIAV